MSTAIPNCIDSINAVNHDGYYESPCTKFDSREWVSTLGWSIGPSPNSRFIKSISSTNRLYQDIERSLDVKRKMAESFGPCQPARTAQADVSRYFPQMH